MTPAQIYAWRRVNTPEQIAAWRAKQPECLREIPRPYALSVHCMRAKGHDGDCSPDRNAE